jgi:hypothetical protein
MRLFYNTLGSVCLSVCNAFSSSFSLFNIYIGQFDHADHESEIHFQFGSAEPMYSRRKFWRRVYPKWM